MRSRRFPALLGFVALGLTVLSLRGAELTFPELNFTITTPDDWVRRDPPKNFDLLMLSPDQSRIVLISVAKSEGPPDRAYSEYRRGVRDGATGGGGSVLSEGFHEAGGIRFATVLLRSMEGVLATQWGAIADGKLYNLAFFSRDSDPATDPALQPIQRSFRFLKAPQPAPAFVPASSPPTETSPASQFSYQAGKIVGYAVFPVLLVVLIVRGRRNAARARPSAPPPLP